MALDHLPDRPQAGPTRMIVLITPSRARDYAVCPYKFAHDKKRFDNANRSLQMGQWIHELIHLDNLARLDGREPPIKDIIAHKAPPMIFQNRADDEEWITDVAEDSLRGYRAFMAAQEFEIILDSERYVRTPTRPVVGVPGCSIILSGRFDVVAMRHDRSIAVIDIKTGKIPTCSQLMDAPESFIYRHLADYTYDADNIDIVQVNPITGQWTSVRLIEDQVEAGVEFCRAMAATIRGQSFEPTPGDQCAYCPIVQECPAFQIRRDGWDTAF